MKMPLRTFQLHQYNMIRQLRKVSGISQDKCETHS